MGLPEWFRWRFRRLCSMLPNARSKTRMQALDALNARYGHGMVHDRRAASKSYPPAPL